MRKHHQRQAFIAGAMRAIESAEESKPPFNLPSDLKKPWTDGFRHIRQAVEHGRVDFELEVPALVASQ